MKGEIPDMAIDHINGNNLDNRFSNLRLATHGQNLMNRGPQKNNKLGIKGVYQRGNKYRSHICKKGKRQALGSFDTPEEASAAYKRAAKEQFGEFARAI